MNYLILIIVGMVGIVLGYYFAQDGGKKVSKQKFKKEKIEKKDFTRSKLVGGK